MAKKPSPAVRIMVPILLLGLGVGVFFAVSRSTANNEKAQREAALANTAAPTPSGATPSDQNATGAEQATPASPPASGVDAAQSGVDAQTPPNEGTLPADPSQPVADAPTGDAAQPAPGDALDTRAWRPVEVAQPDAEPTPIGSLDEASGYELQVRFNRNGASVESIVLTNHYQTIERQVHEVVQQSTTFSVGQGDAARSILASPFALETLRVTGAGAPADAGAGVTLGFGPYWQELSPGVFGATIADAEGVPVLRVTRRYSVRPGSYEVTLRQQVENLGAATLSTTWNLNGPIELRQLSTSYGQDKRRSRFGYTLPDSAYAGGPVTVIADDYLTARNQTIPDEVFGTRKLWPNARSIKKDYALSWAALTNRYFALAVHPAGAPAQDAQGAGSTGAAPAPASLRLDQIARVGSLRLPERKDEPGLILQLESTPQRVAPGAASSLDLAFYAGPLAKEIIQAEPVSGAMNLDGLVVFNFGGPCGFCTFTWLTGPIHAFLLILHLIVRDWALAIILLVVCVRTILHPITKYSQTNMQRFAKQMQGLGPKQKKLQEKYKDDPARLRQEMQRLMKEENVNFAGALGCLPMFLQSPIWIALYATLYFSFELRHGAAFFGLFHSIKGWSFLADLGEPDRFIDFGYTIVKLPMLGEISSINLLPFILGAVFFVHQKYLTPPTSATMTPEQESQQKIVKVLMVVMFPLFLYNAPSGLALYFITNSTLGIIESRHIRAHVEKLEQEGRLHKKRGEKRAPGRKPGFLERIQAELERKSQQQQSARGRPQRHQPGRPGSGPSTGGGRASRRRR